MSSFIPILYSFRRCPYAMRARLALYLAEVSHIHREVSLKNKPSQMLDISPKGTVPVLQLAETVVLEQSLDIMKWALKNPNITLENEQLITENDTSFKYALDRYKYPGRYQEENGTDYRQLCELFLSTLEDKLSPFLECKNYGFTDMAIFPFVRQFSMVDPEWFSTQPYQKLKAWLNFFFTSDLYKQVMSLYSPWNPEDNAIIITF